MYGPAKTPLMRADAARSLVRWECHCQSSPVLLGTYDAGGQIHIKVRDRYWHIRGAVHTVCPRCGSEHELDLGRAGEESRRRGVEEAGEKRIDGHEPIADSR